MYIPIRNFHKQEDSVAQDANTKELARKIRERKRLLNRVVKSVVHLVQKIGKELSYSEGSRHTHVVSELQDFGGFTFHTDLGQTMFGGNTVKVYYHPDQNFRNRSLHDKMWPVVLEVDFQVDFGESKVKTFDEGVVRGALSRVLRNQKRIAAAIKRASEGSKKQLQKLRQDAERKTKLLEEAKELVPSHVK